MTDQHKERRMSEQQGPYTVVRGNHKEDHAIAYWKIVPDAGLPRVAVKQLADDWCAALNAAYAAGLAAGRAASPTPPPTGERPWERLEADDHGPGNWWLVGLFADESRMRICGLLNKAEARAIADAYNAHRPASTKPDDEAIAGEAVDAMNDAVFTKFGYAYVDRDKARRIIADAIRKGRGEP